MKTFLTRLTLLAYFGATCFALGKFTYIDGDGDGYGFFVPHVGGYYVSTLEE